VIHACVSCSTLYCALYLFLVLFSSEQIYDNDNEKRASPAVDESRYRHVIITDIKYSWFTRVCSIVSCCWVLIIAGAGQRNDWNTRTKVSESDPWENIWREVTATAVYKNTESHHRPEGVIWYINLLHFNAACAYMVISRNNHIQLH